MSDHSRAAEMPAASLLALSRQLYAWPSPPDFSALEAKTALRMMLPMTSLNFGSTSSPDTNACAASTEGDAPTNANGIRNCSAVPTMVAIIAASNATSLFNACRSLSSLIAPSLFPRRACAESAQPGKEG